MDDLIIRQEAIDALDKIFPADPMRNDYTQGITCGAALATEYIKQLPSAQPETHDKRTKTHSCDCISRQAVIEINRSYHGQMPNEVNHRIWKEINELPSAQPETHDKRTETHSCDSISRQAAIEAHYEYCNKHPDAGFPVWSLKILENLPSAQPEPCEDAVSREEAKWVVFCNRDHVEDQANAIDALPPVTPKAEQPDLSEYSDKLWKKAYERGRAEAQAEIVRCKDCKYWNDEFAKDKSTCWLPCMSMTTHREWHCGSAERRTDET